MEIKLLIAGSTLLSIAVPIVAGWKLSCPCRQAGQGLWSCLVCATAWELWVLLPPECTFSTGQ